MDALHGVLAPTHALRRLACFLKETGNTLSTADAAALAINQWIAAERGQPCGAPTPTRGYQWKSLFLPEGTELRISSAGLSFYARIVGDALVYGGRAMSPRQMAIEVAGQGRNAWRDMFVLLPGERKWRPRLAVAARSRARRRSAPAVPVRSNDGGGRLHDRYPQDRIGAGRARP